jgi:alkylated DNA nucleotide flippase Atl1
MRLARIPGLPYHRVVAAGGRVGGYGANPQLKADLLRAEGHLIVRRRIRHFSRVRMRQMGKATRGRHAAV